MNGLREALRAAADRFDDLADIIEMKCSYDPVNFMRRSAKRYREQAELGAAMTDEPGWLAEGWRVFQAEVTGKGWPPKVAFMNELAFWGGAMFLMRVLDDEGPTPENLQKLRAELIAHDDYVRDLAVAMAEAQQSEKQ